MAPPPQHTPPTLCLVRPQSIGYSETFIQAHIERLPAHVIAVHAAWPNHAGSVHIVPAPLLLVLRALHVAARGTGRAAQTCQIALRIAETLALSQFLKRHRVDIVLAEYGQMGIQVLNACIQADVPLVVHFHGFDAYLHEVLQQHRAAYRRMFLSASAVIAVSRDMEAQLLNLGARRATLHYNPYGVDPTLFAQTTPATNPPLFIGVGRFVDKKAPHLTLLAFHIVRQACPDARLVLIGDGLLWEACRGIVAALGLTDVVQLPGPLPHHEVAALMQRARAFVQHSIRTSAGDSEGTPVSLLEAGMSGLPVVSTRHAGINDVIIEGETGFLVDEHDVAGMAAAMLRLAEDAELAGRMGQQARAHAVAHFSMEQHIAKLWQILAATV